MTVLLTNAPAVFSCVAPHERCLLDDRPPCTVQASATSFSDIFGTVDAFQINPPLAADEHLGET